MMEAAQLSPANLIIRVSQMCVRNERRFEGLVRSPGEYGVSNYSIIVAEA